MIFILTFAINKGLEADSVSSLFKCELEPIYTLGYIFDIEELKRKGP